MNSIRFEVNVPDLNVLTPVGTNQYNFVAKTYKAADGTPIDNANVPNEYQDIVELIGNDFSFNIPIVDGTYNIPGVETRIYANSSSGCCFARIYYDIENTSTTVSTEAVIMSQLGGNKVYKYEPSTGGTTELFTTVNSFDIAHTSTKLFSYDTFLFEDNPRLRLREYDITLSPFTHSFNKDYLLDPIYSGAGLHAVSNTEVYIANFNLYKITLSGSTASVTTVFALPATYQCTGDLIYDTSTNLTLMLYHKTGDYRIGVFGSTGTVLRSAPAPTNDCYGIYQYEGSTYIITGTGDIYTLNLTTLATTLGGSVGQNISGASQIQSNISIPA
jgi:hypothetical protein